jgi:putative aldouronate transport system permease protein
MVKRKTTRISVGERVFDSANIILMILLCVITIYPMYHVVVGSISNSRLLIQDRGLLLYPRGLSFQAYNIVLREPLVLIGYRNTVIYMLLGCTLNMSLTILSAYALSKKGLLFGGAILLLFTFTMYFDGGLIPLYLLVKTLNMYNTMWAVIVPNAMRVYCMLIMRTSFQQVPDSLEESAKIDGANDFSILMRIVLPISKPVLAVILLYYAVDHWNSYFNALVFLRDPKLFTLQLVLRDILLINSTNASTRFSEEQRLGIELTMKYAVIVVATVPILVVYPFVQKYFAKGVLIGAIKQ